MKIKVLVNLFAAITFSLGVLIASSALTPPPSWFWAFLLAIVYFIVVDFARHEIPNVVRLFLGGVGGTMFAYSTIGSSYFAVLNLRVPIVLIAWLFLLGGMFLNDENIRHVYHSRGVIVVAGFDGSGKTTLARNIWAFLGDRNVLCDFVAFSDQRIVTSVSRTVAGLGGRERNPNSRSKLSFLRPYLAFLDNLQRYLFKVVPAVWRGKFVVCDRFLWQAYLKHEALGYRTWGLRLLSTLVKPDVFIFLHAPYLVVRERINERGYHPPYETEHYHLEAREYAAITEKLSAHWMETGTLSREETLNAALKVIGEECEKFQKEVVISC